MKIRLKNKKRQPLFDVQVDLNHPPSVVKNAANPQEQISLDWNGAINDEGHLRQCPACGCKELFVRNNFPQITGLVIVALAAVISLVMLYHRLVIYACAVLMAVVVLDFVIYFFTRQALVCYRCRTEYHNLPIRKDHPKWDLAIGEKYRQPADPD